MILLWGSKTYSWPVFPLFVTFLPSLPWLMTLRISDLPVRCLVHVHWAGCCVAGPGRLVNWYSTYWRVEVLILLWGSAVAYSCCSPRMLDWLVWSLVISLPIPGCCFWCPLLVSPCLMSEGITSTSARRLVAIGRLDNGPLWLDIPLQNYGFLLF